MLIIMALDATCAVENCMAMGGWDPVASPHFRSSIVVGILIFLFLRINKNNKNKNKNEITGLHVGER